MQPAGLAGRAVCRHIGKSRLRSVVEIDEDTAQGAGLLRPQVIHDRRTAESRVPDSTCTTEIRLMEGGDHSSRLVARKRIGLWMFDETLHVSLPRVPVLLRN